MLCYVMCHVIIHKLYNPLTAQLVLVFSYMFQLKSAAIFRELKVLRHVQLATQFVKY